MSSTVVILASNFTAATVATLHYLQRGLYQRVIGLS